MSSDEKETSLGPQSRRDERRSMQINVKLRRQGEGWFPSRITNLSASGFCIDSFVTVDPGSPIWVMFPGFEGRRATVMWVRGHEAGCQFETPLYEAVLDHIVRQA